MNLLLYAFFIPVIMLGQSENITFSSPENKPINFITKNQDYTNVEAEGLPYLNENFKNGQVIMNGQVKLKGKLRFNAYRNEIEISKGKDSIASVLKRPYIQAEFDNLIFKLYNFKDRKNLNRVAYFNPLNKGKVVLLFKPEKKLKRGRTPSTSYEKYSPPTFINVSSYYIIKEGDVAEKTKLKGSKIIDFLSDRRADINAYALEQKLDLTEQKDVVNLLNYYNNLP